MDLSIVIPIYNEEENVRLLVAELHAALDPLGVDYELVCVDDGSSDASFDILKELAQEDAHLVLCQFRRNFGQTAALQAGLDAARGRVIATMDADLQNDPNDIAAMMAKLDEGYDLVAGWRADRKDTFLNRRLPSIIANRLISATTSVRLHDYGCTLKVMRAEVAKELRLYGEMHRFIPVMASLVGARMCEMKVNHRPRRFGTSKYGIGRTVRVVLDLVTVLFLQSYLARPMQVFGLGGLLVIASGFAILAWLTFDKLVFGAALSNRPLLMLGVLMVLVGGQLISLGLVADVLGRTYHEAQGKPPYTVREWVRGGRSSPPKALPRRDVVSGS
jgi:glycosyltransferase involved in cell wall biosynthesis